jgi:hypothetical protein
MRTNEPTTSNWDTENQYWQNNYNSRPYYKPNTDYKTYEPAYHYGYDLQSRYRGKRFEDINESELERDWESMKSKTKQTWQDAKDAVKDAFNRASSKYKEKV